MKEIGCHFSFESIYGNPYHATDLLFSSGRNCLRYILREKHITTLFLPYFLCESLSEVSSFEGVQIKYYHIDQNLFPEGICEKDFHEESYLYLVNYYGLLRDEIDDIIRKYKYVIVDNTHDFFDTKFHDADVIYNYRKYFGVPDGACIVSQDLTLSSEYKNGKSLGKIIEMVERDESDKFLHYPSFLEADKFFRNEELVYMSNFTRSYLNALDYDSIRDRRLENFRLLNSMLSSYNEWEWEEKELSYMYPFLIQDGERLRRYLKEKNIYAVKLWPNVLWNGSNSSEKERVENMVLLPIDQRYSKDEMGYISKTVKEYCYQYQRK